MKNSSQRDWSLMAIRVAAGAMMLTHGIPKLITLFTADSVQFASVFGMSPTLSLSLAVSAEVFCSILILVGFATRYAAVPLLITMLVAALNIHAADPFAKQELPLLYAAMYTTLIISGAGKFSIDSLISKQQSTYIVSAMHAQRKASAS